ncbi:MAG: tRNA uridine-5-carboxymethylaminomethyl(34) synthesis enzyme MnmG, partial [Gammaproteobacteria bacterium]|nr:tRNA uridine-5-carboxymethylaminomethyl(34) synthesis enzyme MnmG [Gammaproteobacteria bacterium]
GLLAAINAARQVQQREPWPPGRDQAYLGVLIDDLITRGTSEPYRMFTSRAEYRLILREDNADLRLTPVAREMGLVSDAPWQAFIEKSEAIAHEQRRLSGLTVLPDSEPGREIAAHLDKPLSRDYKASDLLRRPELDYSKLTAAIGGAIDDVAVAEQVEIQAKYAGYLERQQAEIEKARRHEQTHIPNVIDYQSVRGLSAEVCQKLTVHRPETIGQASRIPGVTPAAISLLMVHLKKAALK